MQAVVFVKPYELAIRTVPTPTLEAPTDAIVKVIVSAICGSDLHPYRGAEKGIVEGTRMGHEFVGTVVQVGADVKRLAVGVRVCSPFTTNCGDCFYCAKGLTCRCEKGQLFGWVESGGHGLHGGQAGYVRVPLADATLVPVDDGMSDEHALLLGDILSTGFYCAERAGLTKGGGDVAVVVGCGPVGLLAVASACALGAAKVIAVDCVPERLALARELGAATVLDFTKDDVPAAVRAATEGRGADAVLEVVGAAPALRLAVDCLRPGGTLSSVGVHAYERMPFSPIDAYDKNITFKAGRCPARDVMARAQCAMLGPNAKADVTRIITHRLPIAEAVGAYKMFNAREDGAIKILLYPEGGTGGGGGGGN